MVSIDDPYSVLCLSMVALILTLLTPFAWRLTLFTAPATTRRRRAQRAYPLLEAQPAHIALRRAPRCYFPFVQPLGVMGLRPLAEESGGVLLDVDALYQTQVELKRVLLSGAQRAEVFADAGGEEMRARAFHASSEALAFVVDRLRTECPGLIEIVPGDAGACGTDDSPGAKASASRLVNVGTGHWWPLWDVNSVAAGDRPTFSHEEHPLVVAALNVQEDLAVLLPAEPEFGEEETSASSPPAPYVLVAAAVCFADQWELREKIGKSLADIHAPVEKYPKIESAVAGFFRTLRANDERIRYNFTFCERPQLHLPAEPEAADCPVAGTGLPFRVYMRVERQGLVRLERTGAVLFTIRTYLQAVEDVPDEFRADLRTVMQDWAERRTPLGSAHKRKMGERVLEALERTRCNG